MQKWSSAALHLSGKDGVNDPKKYKKLLCVEQKWGDGERGFKMVAWR